MQVTLNDIHKYFGDVKANQGINLDFMPGMIYGVLGENGAGKSTLMKILSGYQPQTKGEILLNQVEVKFDSPQDALARGIGMLYQDPLDFPPFNIVDNYLLGQNNDLILNRKQAIKDLIGLASRYGFEINLEARIDSLSLGQRQQLELVRLLAGGAEVLVLDEPTTGISADQKEVLFESMRKLASEENKTLILVSHKLDEVQELCNHAFVLRKGELVGGAEVPCPNEQLIGMMFDQIPERGPRPDLVQKELVLEVRDLKVDTYRLTVDEINIDLYKGETLAFAGLEGSGQGLLMRALAGLVDCEDGEVILEGQTITNLSHHKLIDAGVAYMPAGRIEEGLVGGLTLTEHLVLVDPDKSFFINWQTARQTTAERIKQFQVVGSPESKAQELSGGNQQRLLFTMLKSPLKVILLDKPTRGLDVRSTNWIWNQLDQWRTDGAGIIFISADLDEIVERSDRIAVFSGGKLLRVVSADETNVEELGFLIGGSYDPKMD